MKVQAHDILVNPTRRELTDAAQSVIDAARMGSAQQGTDDVYEILVVRTPQKRQSELARVVAEPEARFSPK